MIFHGLQNQWVCGLQNFIYKFKYEKKIAMHMTKGLQTMEKPF